MWVLLSEACYVLLDFLENGSILERSLKSKYITIIHVVTPHTAKMCHVCVVEVGVVGRVGS